MSLVWLRHKTRLSCMEVSKSDFRIPFLLFMALGIVLSEDPGFSRMVLELHMLEFIVDLYPDILQLKSSWPGHLAPTQLVLRALLEKLDLVQDTKSIAQLHRFLTLITENAPSSVPPGNKVLLFVRSAISHFQAMRRVKHAKTSPRPYYYYPQPLLNSHIMTEFNSNLQELNRLNVGEYPLGPGRNVLPQDQDVGVFPKKTLQNTTYTNNS
ncbi:hypothetical protein BT96DRAFT_940233 [Gymnopus androsaceus JB14]|uniref:Uncharacterized protein n=1 Tax=Gymnopus androsaceus JB14 TaxID=1447944 RepID=A0A6A4HLR4_9AGAR|nr:hypothetical protein BT96DRAFT_940233 [Gymnopus androsaceus JB14]